MSSRAAQYVATVNTPGYLPEDDEPAVFETARDAWEYLAEEVERDAEMDPRPRNYDRAAHMIQACIADPDGPLTGIWAHDDADPHDLGLVYSVDHYLPEEEI
jgi:hypothetical protein